MIIDTLITLLICAWYRGESYKFIKSVTKTCFTQKIEGKKIKVNHKYLIAKVKIWLNCRTMLSWAYDYLPWWHTFLTFYILRIKKPFFMMSKIIHILIAIRAYYQLEERTLKFYWVLTFLISSFIGNIGLILLEFLNESPSILCIKNIRRR